jgi:hypothetical protein
VSAEWFFAMGADSDSGSFCSVTVSSPSTAEGGSATDRNWVFMLPLSSRSVGEVWHNGEVVVVKAEEELKKTDAIRRTELM